MPWGKQTAGLFFFWLMAQACVGSDPAPSGSSSGSVPDGGGGTGDATVDPSAPQLKLTPVTFRFPVTKPATSSPPSKLTVSNVGGSRAPALPRAVLDGVGAAAFSIATDDCDGRALDAGASCFVDVVFSPPAVGESTANLLIGTLPAVVSGFGGLWSPEDAKGASLNAVWAASATSLFAVGNAGKVLTSKGDGAWTEEPGTAGSDLHAVYGTPAGGDTTAGIVLATGVGPRLLRRAVTGTAWEAVSLTPPPGTITSGRALWATPEAPHTAYLFGETMTNGKYFAFGANTAPGFTSATSAASGMDDIFALSGYVDGGLNTVLCAVGVNGMIYGFQNGGNAGAGSQAATSGVTLRGLYTDRPSAAARVIAVGDNGAVLRGTGCTLALTPDASNVSVQLNAVWASGPDVYAVGNGGTIIHSQGTDPWVKEESGTTQDLRGVFGTAPDNIYVVGDKVILHKK